MTDTRDVRALAESEIMQLGADAQATLSGLHHYGDRGLRERMETWARGIHRLIAALATADTRATEAERDNASFKETCRSLQAQVEDLTLKWRAAVNATNDAKNEARAEVERLRGITPEFPPRPPNGEGVPRYGLRWNGPELPLAVPMDDGYWAPAHLAQQRIATLTAALRAIKQDPHGCRFCDSGVLRNSERGHDAGCGFALLDAALTGEPEAGQ